MYFQIHGVLYLRRCINRKTAAEGGVGMFGIADPWIWGAYLLCIFSTVLCVAYGLRNWNKGADEERLQMAEAAEWENSSDRK
jgi:hypothetical protein